MTPAIRKLSVTLHVLTSVGWLGAVAAFLVLGIAAWRSANIDMVRGAYLGMNLLGLLMIVPMSLLSVATGLVLAVGTEWGLRRYYWVLVKLLWSVLATMLLLLHQFTAVASAAALVVVAPTGTMPHTGTLGTQLVLDASLGLIVLIAITCVSVYKPWGRTRTWQRQVQQLSTSAAGTDSSTQVLAQPVGLRVLLGTMGLLAVAAVASHLAGGGMHRHAH